MFNELTLPFAGAGGNTNEVNAVSPKGHRR
jgi:hypothetical protein